MYQLATIEKPLHQLAEKDRDFEWYVQCEKAFQANKKRSASSLACPTETDKFVIKCGSSNEVRMQCCLRFRIVKKR